MNWYLALIERRRRSRALQRSISRLPELHRRILLLTARDRLSLADAADRLGISTETVQAELARALISLARDLARDGDG